MMVTFCGTWEPPVQVSSAPSLDLRPAVRSFLSSIGYESWKKNRGPLLVAINGDSRILGIAAFDRLAAALEKAEQSPQEATEPAEPKPATTPTKRRVRLTLPVPGHKDIEETIDETIEDIEEEPKP